MFSGNQAIVSHISEFNLSEKCITLCISAKSILENICVQIANGNITLLELSQMEENYEHLMKLLVETVSDAEVKTLQQLLAQRFLEQRCFTERLNDIRQLCQNVNVNVDGM